MSPSAPTCSLMNGAAFGWRAIRSVLSPAESSRFPPSAGMLPFTMWRGAWSGLPRGGTAMSLPSMGEKMKNILKPLDYAVLPSRGQRTGGNFSCPVFPNSSNRWRTGTDPKSDIPQPRWLPSTLIPSNSCNRSTRPGACCARIMRRWLFPFSIGFSSSPTSD